jgi:hypothetical protein
MGCKLYANCLCLVQAQKNRLIIVHLCTKKAKTMTGRQRSYEIDPAEARFE